MRLPGKVTSRIVAVLAVSQLAGLAVALLLMQAFTTRIVRADSQEFATELRAGLVEDFKLGGRQALTSQIEAKLAEVGHRDVVLALKDTRGGLIVGNLSAWPATFKDNEAWRIIQLYRAGAASPERMGLEASRLADGSVLLVGQVLEDESLLTQSSERAFLYALPLALLIVALNVWFAMRLLRSRVSMIARVAHDFQEGDHEARIDPEAWGDSFEGVAGELNQLLGHNERLIRELRMVADSLAHDLRTPVTRIKVTLEQAIGRTRDGDALKALGMAVEEADLLQGMLTTALDITRAEAGIGRDRFTTFLASDLMCDIAEVYGPLAEEMGLAITVDAPEALTVTAHKDLLTRALSNLVDNALKYAEGGSRIILGGGTLKDGIVELSVSDDGPGIPADQIDEALRRFGRLDTARTKPGAGLGLSLVETVAALHGGTMGIESALPHGLKVTLQMQIGQPA